jgi:hypothetical protein
MQLWYTGMTSVETCSRTVIPTTCDRKCDQYLLDNLEVVQSQNVLCSTGKELAKPRSSGLANANQCQYCNEDFKIQLYEPCWSLLRLLHSLDLFLELRHAQWIPTTAIF